MKQLYNIIVCGVLLFSLCGCSSLDSLREGAEISNRKTEFLITQYREDTEAAKEIEETVINSLLNINFDTLSSTGAFGNIENAVLKSAFNKCTASLNSVRATLSEEVLDSDGSVIVPSLTSDEMSESLRASLSVYYLMNTDTGKLEQLFFFNHPQKKVAFSIYWIGGIASEVA